MFGFFMYLIQLDKEHNLFSIMQNPFLSMPRQPNTQTPNLVELRRIKSCLISLEKLTQTDAFPQDNTILSQVGAVRNHGERFVLLVNELERMLETKQRFCEHREKVRLVWDRFYTKKVCVDCRKILTEPTVARTWKQSPVCVVA